MTDNGDIEDHSIDDAANRIKLDIDKLKCGGLPRIEVDTFNLVEFWSQLESAVQALSNEVTKVGFMCGKKPFPSKLEVDSMVKDVFQRYSFVKELYLVLPEEVGDVVFKATTSAVQSIMTALLDIIRSLNNITEKGAKERLILTGTLWDACNSVETLPKNNLLATLKLLDDEYGLVNDALDELNTTIEEDEEDPSDNGWTEVERDLALKALGLVKVTQLCLKKIRKAVADCGSCDSPQHSKQLDLIVQDLYGISPALDDFVSELYHPVDFPVALQNAGKLVSVLHKVLTTSGCHFQQGISKATIAKLRHFINHNHRKIDPEVTSSIPDITSLNLNT